MKWEVLSKELRQRLIKDNPGEVMANGIERRDWTHYECEILKAVCVDPTKPVDIALLANAFGRSYYSVALKISRMGLGSFVREPDEAELAKRSEVQLARWEGMTLEERRAKCPALLAWSGKTFKGKHHSAETKRQLSELVAAHWKEHGHPRGMLGKHHTEEVKAILSASQKGKIIPEELIKRRLHAKAAKGTLLGPRKGSWKAGWRIIGGKRIFARSRWEANYARYLEFQKVHAQIKEWEHEATTFWFEEIKRGARSYTPDFRITNNDGTIEYHEVKGWMDSRSKTTIRRMGIYHPHTVLKVFDADWFKRNTPNLRGMLPGWEGNNSIL